MELNCKDETQSMADTFWTTCYQCNMQYELEFLEGYLNKTLLCPKCKQPLSVDDPNSSSDQQAASMHQQRQPATSHRVHEQKVHDSGRNEPTTGGNVGLGSSGRSHGASGAAPKLTRAEIRTMLIAKGRKVVSDELAAESSARQVKERSDPIDAKLHRMDCDINDASVSVPDPDFHDFDQDRTETSFADSEVWAAYDDGDSMPRFYAMVVKVLSRDPFKLKIRWLDAKTNAEFSYKTCGEFKLGERETCKILNSFSQKVKWSRGPRGSVRILPEKGDVWALYKNWSPDWNEHTPKEVVRKYEMVMVLDDYDEESGVSVAPLSKVAGFKTVFRNHADDEATKRIPREEMFRFSHRVPKHVLTGDEAPNAPKGYVELDPAATPLEFLGVVTEEN